MIIPSQSEFEASVQLVKDQAPPPALCYIVSNSQELINVLDAGRRKLSDAKTQTDIEIVLMTFLVEGMLICDSFHGERNKEK